MSSSYKTIAGESEAVLREKMSKFMAFAYPVDNEADARMHIDRLRNRYHDARHVCWAYMLGADRLRSMANDNGEPSGTAGRPILGQINSFGLTNIVVGVVRYFGGIKLGTSGLIAAYRDVTRMALENAEIVERAEMAHLNVVFGYMSMNNVMKLVKSLGLEVISQSFDNTCSLCLSVRRDAIADMSRRFNDIDGVQVVDGQ